MTLEQLRIFLKVADCMHFTHAAEALYITQPAVSAAIQSLEEQYKIKLFHRIGRRIEITEAGKFLQAEAQNLTTQVVLIERGLQEFNGLQKGELKLGASQTIGNYFLPGFIARFKQEHPGIEINCSLNNTEIISAGVMNGEFDLGLVEGEIEASFLNTLEQQAIGSDYLQIVVGKGHPWFETDIVSVTEFPKTNWIMRESGSGTRQIFEQFLDKWSIKPAELQVILEMSSGEMVKAVVENGVGATAISGLMIKKEIELGILHPIKVIGSAKYPVTVTQIIRPFLLIKHKERFQTQSSHAFEKLLVTNSNNE
ncbi:MAG: LysR family transcriptional regulator [Rivularia sp. (in: Bacteria)]|nr:LysR family transcriptional regulator [Rivularia sp. MS3]